MYNNLYLFSSVLISFSFYSFGNFAFLNLFGIKLYLQFFIMILLLPIIFFVFFNKLKFFVLKEPISVLIFYSLLSQLIIRINDYMSNLQLLLSLIIIVFIFILQIKYINFIIKLIVITCFLFTVLHLIQFFILLNNYELINFMSNNFSSNTHFIDLSNVHWFEKMGFIINGHKHSLFLFETYRFKSFASEPSVLVYSFFAVGCIALTYSKIFKFLGIIILFFVSTLPYSGVIHMILIYSGLAFIFLNTVKNNIYRSNIILFAVISSIVFMGILPDIMINLAPDWKEGSSFIRFGNINLLLTSIYHNPLVNLEILSTVPTSLILNSAQLFPILGIVITIILFKNLFGYLVNIFNQYKIYSSLSIGMFVVVATFSHYGWTTLSGWIILSLIYIRTRYLVLMHNEKIL